MVKLNLYSYEDSPEGSKLLIRHLLLGLRGNDALTDLTLRLPHAAGTGPKVSIMYCTVFHNYKILCALHNYGTCHKLLTEIRRIPRNSVAAFRENLRRNPRNVFGLSADRL